MEPIDGAAPVTPAAAPDLLARRVDRHETLQRARSHALARELARREQLARNRRVPYDGLGHPALDELRDLHGCLLHRVRADIADGATVHRRLPRLLRNLPLAVALLDGLLLYSFCADIFNARATEISRNSLAALSLALLGSGMAYGWLAMTGGRLRDYRGPLGETRWGQTDWSTRGLCVGALTVMVALGTLMYTRVSEKAAMAGDVYVAPDQVAVLGLVFAVLSVCANAAVVAIHALDGSTAGAYLRQVGRAIDRAERKAERSRRSAWRRVARDRSGPDALQEAQDGRSQPDTGRSALEFPGQ